MAILSEKEAARELGVARGTLQQWRVKGLGPAFVKVGPRKIGYRPEDLQAYITPRVRHSTSETVAA